jgi:hypothetical protein
MDKIIRTVPNTPGKYWARKNGTKWWHRIVSVQGEAPMLRIAWILELCGIDAPKLITGYPGDIEEWGPEIPDCEQEVVLSEFEKRHI